MKCVIINCEMWNFKYKSCFGYRFHECAICGGFAEMTSSSNIPSCDIGNGQTRLMDNMDFNIQTFLQLGLLTQTRKSILDTQTL